MLARAGWGLVLAGVVVACGPEDDGPDASDAGADASRPDIPWLDAGVPPIAAPMLTPCPEGWHEVLPETERGTVTCHPYAGVPDVCPDGSTHFVGEAGCMPVGAACPTGDYPEGLPTDVEVLFVLSSATMGGDGSEGSPHSTIGEAMAAASPGTVIAIGKGTYDEVLSVDQDMRLWGACAQATRLTASSPSPKDPALISVRSAEVQLQNLRLGPADLRGVSASGTGTSVSIDGVLVEGVQSAGIFAFDGARVSGHTLSISGTRANDSGSFGRGVVAFAGGNVDLTRAQVSENGAAGVFGAGGGTSVTLSDVVVEGNASRGINVQGGASAEVTRALVSGNRGISTFAAGDGTTLTLSDVVVEDGASWGLAAQLGARVEVSRALLSRQRELGVFVNDELTALTLSDVVVEGTRGRESDDAGGRGVNIQNGATAAIARALLSGNRELGVFVSEELTSLTLSDVVVEGTESQESDGTGGRGLGVQAGATVTVTRGLLSGNRETGVFAQGLGTSVGLTDVAVVRTEEQACGATTCSESPFGVGLIGTREARLAVTRFTSLESALCGMMVAEDGEVDLSQGLVAGSPVGVCLQVDGYAVSRLTDGVRFVDNGTNLDTTRLPVPEGTGAVGATE